MNRVAHAAAALMTWQSDRAAPRERRVIRRPRPAASSGPFRLQECLEFGPQPGRLLLESLHERIDTVEPLLTRTMLDLAGRPHRGSR